MRQTLALFAVLALAVGFFAGGGCRGYDNSTGPKNNGGGNDSTVVISGSSFSSLTVNIGTSVYWKNNDGTAHTATSDNTSAFSFDTGNIAGGATSHGVPFTQAGTFPYHCTYHSGMHGTITVRP